MEIDPKNRPVLFGYFKCTADVLLSEHKRSAEQNASANLGRNRELFCKEFLSKVLPTKLSVKSGEIWDSMNNKTGQEDIIILREDSPILHVGSDNIHFAEGTFAVIEVKSNLTRDKLLEAGNNLKKVEELKINVGASISSGATLSRPLRIIFAYEGAKWETLLDEINKNRWDDLFDLICILNRGVLIKKGRLVNWENKDEFIVINGKAAALGFMFFYLVSYGSSFLGRNLILTPYFEPLNFWDATENSQ
ncbi:hypothetical protein HYY69_01125 [Candidatus Woesearchaeota archaeon]|nr:hypothetical protein [Candidatus Woesearchaeota archaeon]